MSFTQAIRSVLSQYVGFTGRARRSEFWWWFLFTVLVGIVVSILDQILGTTVGEGFNQTGVFGTIASLALILPNLAVSVRRLHDTGRSGWWILIGLVPIVGFIVLLVFYVQDSKPGPNQHGPNPKETGQSASVTSP
jgi:uncharacterized membrane protein YhaH (DUF805 family)